jgi:hypothetical protein
MAISSVSLLADKVYDTTEIIKTGHRTSGSKIAPSKTYHHILM